MPIEEEKFSSGQMADNAEQSSSKLAADLEQLTSIFRLLSDKTRLNILLLLSDGEKNVTHLCQELDLPQPTVSHHLGLLRENQVISNRRDGKQVYYALLDQVGIANKSLQLKSQGLSISIKPTDGDTGQSVQ